MYPALLPAVQINNDLLMGLQSLVIQSFPNSSYNEPLGKKKKKKIMPNLAHHLPVASLFTLEIKPQVFIMLYKVPHTLTPACLFHLIFHSLPHSLGPSHTTLPAVSQIDEACSCPRAFAFAILQPPNICMAHFLMSSSHSAFTYSVRPKTALSNPLSHFLFLHSTFEFHILWYIDLPFSICLPRL